MEENTEGQQPLPFEVEHDEDFDWLDLTIDVHLTHTASDEERSKIEEVMGNWANKGIDEGYGEGKMHSWDDEENEWSKGNKSFRFWVDMGTDDETAIDTLFGELAKLGLVKKVRIGSRYYD
jgi:hypothetical protein